MGSNGSRNFSRTASPAEIPNLLRSASSNGSRNFSRTASMCEMMILSDRKLVVMVVGILVGLPHPATIHPAKMHPGSNGSRNFSRTASFFDTYRRYQSEQ